MSELYELLGRLADGEPPSERLKELLAADPKARRVYREYLNLHVALKSYGAIPDLAATRRSAWRSLLGTAAAAALLAALLLTPPAPELARLTKRSGARWGDGRPSLRAGSRVDLVFGYAELTLANRVRLVLEAPVRLRLESTRRIRLESGRVVAEVPPEARGFVIDTPPARVVDLGTEFGVGVREDGETEVQVFRGEVVAEYGGARHLLEAGRAVRIDPAASPPRGIEFQSDRFVRLFPTDDDGGQPAGPQYNQSRVDAVQALPAPPGRRIDGDLSDWDASGAFSGACRPPYHGSHTLEGMLSYDERFLYVAARVGDPAPMRSVTERTAWRGGSVILRLATKLPWPLEAKGPPLADAKHPEIGRRPVDVHESIAHLTFWYHRPTSTPRLHLSYGMNFHGEREHPEGWSGVFQERPDGLGYTIEYRVPWALLHAEAPRAGDILPSTWTVHWSDREGTLSRGHLVEVTNPDEQPFRFLRGRCWGKAVFR